ncbi:MULTISPECIES: class 1 fructose-bisphosphatase [Psychrobacter]|jgi:fructose-1,6-bisphosphatase I|uniref:Fructose-1,6-bisphosphatase class 1 n=1 Tax=Psychrobacter pacificensis TaxID=112002 RepID=A0A1G6XBA8_9GAMM|nr:MULTISPECIES: class 1 fructose-bisphosphatase [Psychrobacter]GLR30061.1 fructose-1,6-bisphosphatase class 1 [Psychrobacter pacificensis]SDD74565.1 D-fructose 1,6-bisphosphatase [Psychrobacter pacificensis]HBD02959.1 class 1 fructose-bisphosphatase [Psychrobacter sp.]HBL97036.1 class 1 fructose-bisphosphatase [Psychrobacter sp.]|tara:strand:+ start:243 stop:1226 length:984 start_codon:yes stop_codon:yes gene_type:complete
MTTLADYLNQHASSPALNDVITTVTNVGKTISQLLRKGALADILGEAGNQNVQGEDQKKLDILANDLLLDALAKNTHCAGVASEELDDATPANDDGSLLVLFDPLDGSSNIDINMAVGTIFSVLPYERQGQTSENSDYLQAGNKQLAAGYLLYGTSTVLALTIADKVVMFSLDPETEDYVLIEDNVQIDADTSEYAINSSNYRYWRAPMQQYIDELIAGETGVRGRDFNTRWVAAMVGDVHRILCRGGLFTYPFDTKYAHKAGKLRLMYEANPMSLLIERAGGGATDAVNRILDIEPTDIHQRVPVVLGSKNEVNYVRDLHVNYSEQ